MVTAEDNFRVEVWTPDGSQLVETISRSSDFLVSLAAWHAAIRQRPGVLLIHMNARFPMDRLVSPGEPVDVDRGRIDANLGDLRHWHRVRAWCVGCQHHRWMDFDDLMARVGAAMPFSEIEKKLSCSNPECAGGRVRLEIHNAPRD